MVGSGAILYRRSKLANIDDRRLQNSLEMGNSRDRSSADAGRRDGRVEVGTGYSFVCPKCVWGSTYVNLESSITMEFCNLRPSIFFKSVNCKSVFFFLKLPYVFSNFFYIIDRDFFLGIASLDRLYVFANMDLLYCIVFSMQLLGW